MTKTQSERFGINGKQLAPFVAKDITSE